MSTHYRRRIREAVRAMLTGATTAGANVFTGRTIPLSDIDSAVLVFARDEQSQRGAMGRGGRALDRVLQLHVEARVALASTDPEDILDAMAVDIERAMASNETIDGLVRDSHLVSTELDARAASDMREGIARLTYTVEYSTLDNDPTRGVD